MKSRLRARLLTIVLAMTLCIALMASGCTTDNSETDDKNKATEQPKSKDATGWELADEIVKKVKENEPVFDDYEVSIEDFGAEVKTDQITDKNQEKELAKSNTEAIHKAIKDVSEHTGKNGQVGGTVKIPAGYTYTGAIHLEDNVNLHLEDGSHVMFTTDYDQYPNVLQRWEGIELYNYSPMVYAYQKKNIAITGSGTLDAQATEDQYWLPWKNTKYLPEETQTDDRDALFQMSADKVPVEERVFGPGHYLRPSFIMPFECENVLIEDITITNSPFWMVNPVLTNYLTVRNITLDSLGYNNDGCNPDSCKYVVIEENTFKTGDDCIAVKSGRNEDGWERAAASEYIVAQNNLYVTGKGSSATIGSEMSGDVRNVFFRNNKAEDTVDHLTAVHIKTNADRGGIIEDIYIKDIESEHTIDRAIIISMFYEEADTKKTTPVIRNIFIEDSTFKTKDADKQQDLIAIWGYDRSMIENVNFKNCTFEGSDAVLNVHNVQGLSFENCKANGKKLPEGEFKPEENTGIINTQVKKDTISLQYTCGAEEGTLNPHFVVSDTEDGEYVPVANTDELEKEFIMFGAGGSQVKLLKIDSTKYYKFVMTVNDTEWESEVLHYKE